jgi:hypothetical protein
VAEYQRRATSGDNQYTLSTEKLPTGLYTLQIQGNQTSSVQRLEVKH